jgi:hypothetical protein
VNVSRLVCGLAVPFDEAGRDGSPARTRAQFETFVDLETGLPLRWQHESLYGSREMVQTIGVARRFALVPDRTTPAGVLTLGELDDIPWCDSLLKDIDRRQITGLSFGLDLLREEHIAFPFELSICFEPVYDNARIIGTGRQALEAWELLTAQPALERAGGMSRGEK